MYYAGWRKAKPGNDRRIRELAEAWGATVVLENDFPDWTTVWFSDADSMATRRQLIRAIEDEGIWR